MKTIMKKNTVSIESIMSSAEALNTMIEETQNALIEEAIRHFNTLKSVVRDREDDARFFYSLDELNRVLRGLDDTSSVWVSTLMEGDKVFCYRMGRVILTKKGELKQY